MGLHGAYSRVSDFREIARKPFSENEQCPRGFVEVVVVEEWERVHTVWVGCRPCSQGVERGRYFIKGDPLPFDFFDDEKGLERGILPFLLG